MAHYVIYIPGLGDHRSYGQSAAIKLWRLFGVKPLYLPLGWNKKEGIDTKLSRLLNKVTELKSAGHSVALVGVSAGASAVLNAYASSDDINRVICICGKINNPQTIPRHTYDKNPDFEESLQRLSESMAKLDIRQRKNIMSIHPWKDQTVPVADTIIMGAKEKTLPGWSHVTGIFFGIVVGSRTIARFITSKVR